MIPQALNLLRRHSLVFLIYGALSGTGAARAAELPQDHPWERTLRAWLATLTEDKFTVANHTFALPADYDQRDNDRLYRDWIVLGHLGREPSPAGFQAAAQDFLLNRIEGDQIRIYPEPAALAWWIQLDVPGNPYRGSPGGKHRALVIAVVDMLMLETAQVSDPRNLKPDFMGANLGTWAYALRHAGDVLPEEVQAAYRQGMLHYLAEMERLAPRDGNTNMDMREIATLAELDKIFAGDPTMHRRLVDDARRILFGNPHRGPATSDPRRGTFHPAGYIGEADGPETSYNGISLFHLAEAAMITHGDADWDAFMPEVIRRMVLFKAHNTFPEPDGAWEGPSSWAKRTNDPYPRDQRDRPWRPFAEAMLTDEALFRLRIDPDAYAGTAYGLANRETMLADIRQGVARLNRSPKRPEKWTAQQAPVWAEFHWPADIPYTWDHYLPGSYARFQKLLDQRSPLLDPPFARQGDFNVDFDGEFWSVKRGDWGFQVEAVPHMGRSYDTGGSGALAGGSLAAFWTRDTGVTVLGRLPDKWNYVTWDKIESWPTHHLWGRTVAGPAFSSARQRDPWVHFQTDAQPPQVHVLGGLGMDRTVQEPKILDTEQVHYRRTFTLRDDGLHVRSEILSQGADSLAELWETLPIFLNRTQGPTATDATIEFRIKGVWRPGGTELLAGVEAVRVRRFSGAVRIEFDQPQRVRLSEVIATAYQKQDRLQNLKIDLLGAGARPAPMPRRAAVSYLIRRGD